MEIIILSICNLQRMRQLTGVNQSNYLAKTNTMIRTVSISILLTAYLDLFVMERDNISIQNTPVWIIINNI